MTRDRTVSLRICMIIPSEGLDPAASESWRRKVSEKEIWAMAPLGENDFATPRVGVADLTEAVAKLYRLKTPQ